jgi:hypothetical protein
MTSLSPCPPSTGTPAGECEKNLQFMRGDAFTLGNCRASCGDCEVCQDDDIGERGVVCGMGCVLYGCVGLMSCEQVFVSASPGHVLAGWPPRAPLLTAAAAALPGAACKSRNRVKAGYLPMEDIM